MRKIHFLFLATALAVSSFAQEPSVGIPAGGGLNLPATARSKPTPRGTSLPGTCEVGEYFFKTDATTGQNTYACTATNVWTLQGDGGGASGYQTVQDEGSPLTQRATLNFTGDGVSCADNAGQSRTDCAVSGGGAGGGDNISVNGTAASDADFDDATPTAPANSINTRWQKDGLTPNNVSANVPYASPLTVSGGNLTVASNSLTATHIDETTNFTFTGTLLGPGALTCGAGTAGKALVHTTPLQYCDNAATPALQYAAYGDSSGNAKTGDSATAFFSSGTIETARLPTIPESLGGTNQTTYALGDLLYASGANTLAKLTGNTTTTKKFLTQTGDGADSAAPGWNTIAAGDLPATTTSAQGASELATQAETATGTDTGRTVTPSGVAPTIQSGSYLACADAGASDSYSCTMTPTLTTYTTGMVVILKANTTNTGAASLNIDTRGAKTIVKLGGGITTALADNDIRAGQWTVLVYDGTNFQMQGLLGNAAAGGSGYATVQEEGTSLTQRATLNVVGRTVVADDSGGVTRLRVCDNATMACVKDDFLRTVAASGNYGEYGWIKPTGGTAALTVVAGRPGGMRLNTSTTVSTNTTFLSTDGVASMSFDADESFDELWIIRPSLTGATTPVVRVGLNGDTGSSTSNPPTDGMWIEKEAADTNWFAETRTGSASDTRVDLGVAVSAVNFATLRMYRVDSTTIGFQVDGGTINCITSAGSAPGACTGTNVLNATKIFTGGVRMFASIINQTVSTAETLDLDYFDIIFTGLAR